MEYYVKSVVPIIESNYDKFTTVERNIADFFIQNRKKVDFSSKSISERIFVSEASISESGGACVRVRNRKFRSGGKRDGTTFYGNRCGY